MNSTYGKILFTLILVMVLLGTLTVFSASKTISLVKLGNQYSLGVSHLVKIGFAFLAGFLMYKLPISFVKKYSKFAVLVVFLAIIYTLFTTKIKGAGRWIDLYIFSVQPAEFAKFALIVHLAKLIEKKEDLIENYKEGLMYFLVWIIIFCGVIILQPNMSTSIILFLSSMTLLYIGGAKFKHLAGTTAVIGSIGVSFMMLFSHFRERIITYYHSLSSGGDINMQVKQAKIGLGSGGWFGLGIGQSRQSDLFLPEPYGDFIFSIIGEEYGLFGTFIIMMIYLVIFLVGFLIAKRAQTKFEQLLVFGLSFNLILNATINIGVVVGLFPTTGITLPFISFGGSSLLQLFLSYGLILNVAKRINMDYEPKFA